MYMYLNIDLFYDIGFFIMVINIYIYLWYMWLYMIEIMFLLLGIMNVNVVNNEILMLNY